MSVARISWACVSWACLLAVSITPAFAGEETQRLSSLTLASWRCAALASIAERLDEATRLFGLGYTSAESYLSAVKSGKIDTESSAASEIGLLSKGLSFQISGLTIDDDFLLGSIWSQIFSDVSNKTYDFDDWGQKDLGRGMQKYRAKIAFTEGNCEFLK